MKLDHHFLLMICVLFCAQIIQADLIHGLLGFGDKDKNSGSDGSNNNPSGSVSPSSPNNTPNSPPLPEPSHPPNNNNDNYSPPASSNTPPSPVQSSSPTIPPLSNSHPSPLPSPAPGSSNMDNSGPGTDTAPAQPNKSSPPSTTAPNSGTKESNEPNDTSPPSSKNRSSDGGYNAGNSKNNDTKSKNSDPSSNSDVNAKTPLTEADDPAASSSTPESNPHSNTGTIAGTVVGGIVGLALIGGMVTWCNRKGGCTKRQKHGARDGFNQKDDSYSIDMHPHATSTPGINNTMDITAPTGMTEMTPASPFDHSRRLVAGAGPPNGAVPAYTDTHYQEHQGYEQNYQVQRQYYHYNEVPIHQGEVADDSAGYYYQQDHDQQQQQQQQHLNHGDYYPSDNYKPDSVDHNYKPNAI